MSGQETITCWTCGVKKTREKVYRRHEKQRTFCSLECFGASVPRGHGQETITCDHCGKTKTRPRRNQGKLKFCSRECAGAAVPRGRNLVEFRCSNCGVVRLRPQAQLKGVRFPCCSRKCAGRLGSART